MNWFYIFPNIKTIAPFTVTPQITMSNQTTKKNTHTKKSKRRKIINATQIPYLMNKKKKIYSTIKT